MIDAWSLAISQEWYQGALQDSGKLRENGVGRSREGQGGEAKA